MIKNSSKKCLKLLPNIIFWGFRIDCLINSMWEGVNFLNEKQKAYSLFILFFTYHKHYTKVALVSKVTSLSD